MPYAFIHIAPFVTFAVKVARDTGPSNDKALTDWLTWVQTAEELVRGWERERGAILPTHDATRLVELIARALQQAAEKARERRWR